MSTGCPHTITDVVIPMGSDQVVARICTSCFDRLPANWGCQECDWEEIHEFGVVGAIPLLSVLCDDHRYLEGL